MKKTEKDARVTISPPKPPNTPKHVLTYANGGVIPEGLFSKPTSPKQWKRKRIILD